MTTRTLLAVALMAIGLAAGSARAAEPVNTNGTPLALGGYDVMAYFTEGKPVVGQAAHEARWNGARWRFASAEHRDYLNYSTDVQKLWEADITGNVRKADTSWPGVLAK